MILMSGIKSSEKVYSGTYTITKDEIIITYETDKTDETKNIYYIYEDDKLELFIRSESGNEWELIHYTE